MPLGGSLPTMLPESAGSVFYVDPNTGSDGNPGTIGSPWASLSKCNSALTAGQTAYLRSGVYGDATTGQNFTMAGTASDPITIRGYPGETADVRTRLTPTTGHHIRFGPNLTFTTPCYVSGSPDAYIYVNGGDDIEVVGNTFRNSDHSAIYANPSSQRVHIIQNLFADNGDGTSPQDHGIYCDANPYLIIGNVIYDSFVFGIQCVADGVSIANAIIAFNTVYSNGQSDGVTPAGIMIDSTGGATHSTTITSNILSTNNSSGVNGFGIRVLSDAGAESFSQSNVILNNAAGAYQDTGNWLTESGDITAGSEGFVDAANRDLRIDGTSAGLDLGDPDYCLPIDFLGNPRNDPPDIGAYEFGTARPYANVTIGG